MGAIEGLLYGMSVMAQPENILAALAGVLIGTAIGVLPGLGPLAAAALILPITYTMSPTVAVIAIASIYAGSMYGGSTTSVLLKIPGETASIITTIDGHKMAQQGRAGVALSIMAIGSMVAALISVVFVALLSPSLSRMALNFGAPEFFALTAGGLLALARVTGFGSLASALFPLFVGLSLSTIGQEALSGVFRYTFGVPDLAAGLDLTAIFVGFFGLAEVLLMVEAMRGYKRPPRVPMRSLIPTRTDLKRSLAPWGRGTLIGFFFGLLPGPAGTMASFTSYKVEKTVSRYRREIGSGAIEGVAGPEASNNAAATSALIPVLTLGLPFSATYALMLAALVVQGINPGPLLITDHPEIFWGLIVALLLGNVMLLVLNLPLVGVWILALRIPVYVLAPLILLFAVVGVFSSRNSHFDLWVLIVAGIAGALMMRLGFDMAPLALGFILGPIIEQQMRTSLVLSRGDVGVFVESPISKVIWAVVAIVLVAEPLIGRLARRRGTASVLSGTDVPR